MSFTVIVNADKPDGGVGSWHVGYADTIRETERGIRHAVGLARDAGGTAICVRFLDRKTGGCRYLARIKEQEATPHG